MKVFLGLLALLNSPPWASAMFFSPGEDFGCNDGIATMTCVSWDVWASQPGFNTSEEVIIPCGKCVEIVESTDITTPLGINIQGRLRLAPPQGSKVTIRTGSILVQGILSIDTPYAPSINETVNFIMTDRGQDYHFEPFEEFGDNHIICHGSHCNVGRRPIAVAGGRLDIKGLPDDCATWKRLKSVSTSASSGSSSAPVFQATKSACYVEIMDENFDNASRLWAPHNNALVYARNDNLGTYLETTNRHIRWQGISRHLDDSFMSCVDAGIPYLVTLSMKITGLNDTVSDCASGINCPYIFFRRKILPENADTRQTIVRVNQGMIPGAPADKKGWFPVTGIVTFSADDLVTQPYYRYIYLEGASPGESFAVDSFHIKRADSSYFRSDTCSELITNGDAELDQTSIHPYPVRAADSQRTSLTVQKETEPNNQFFHVSGRKNDWSTFRVDLSQDCMSPQHQYTFTLKARSSAAIKYDMRFVFFTKKDDGSNKDKWNSISMNRECFAGANQWAECTGSVLLSDPKIFEAHSIFVDVRTLNAADKTADMDFDDLSFKFAAGSVEGFVVEASGVDGCWTAGSKVLLTSDTTKFEDDTVATIKSVQAQADGTVALTFQEELSPRSSAEDGFPIEIALLERNVKFESDNTEGHNQGGHLIVVHTKDVAQMIDGVELFKFGQRGNLGRYVSFGMVTNTLSLSWVHLTNPPKPLHMHMSSFVKNETYIKRNLIHYSNQRCIVIHGTHGVNVEQNVAYDSFGHCYMLEDGGEINNRFVGNLAAAQHKTEVENLVRDNESDDNPSAFWITNPMNTYIGNIAAGGEGSGYWLELEKEVKSPSVAVVEGRMFELNLTEFRDNTAHSHRSHGLSTYQHGYMPKTRARFENTMSYKNKGSGVFFHNSWNLLVAGGVFADNRRQIQIHRADDVHVEDVDIYGQTQSYVDAQSRTGRWGLCPSSRSSQYGITIHSHLFRLDRQSRQWGPTFKNIRFFNLSDSITGCGNTSAIEIHDDDVEVHFDSWTKFEDLQFDQSSIGTAFSMCKAVAEGLQDVVIEVVGGDQGNGFITSRNQAELTAFLPMNSCTDLGDDQCANFCADACLRTIRFLADPYVSELMVLEVSANGTTIEINDSGLTNEIITRSTTYRIFSVVLPVGNYSMRFLKDEEETWPGFVREDPVEAPSCWSANASFIYSLSKPPLTCDVLISDSVRNGNLEGSLQYWQHVWSGIELVNPGVNDIGNAAISPRAQASNIGQHMDTRCLVEGDEYEFTARVRSVDSVDGGGSSVECDPNANNAGVRCSYANILSEFINGAGERDTEYKRIAHTVASTSTDSWKTIHGVFKITEHMAQSDAAFVYVQGGPAFVEVDNMALHKFDRDDLPIILNGDFEVGDHRFWTRGRNDGLAMVTGDTGVAIRTTKNYKSIQQYLGPGALEDGKRYLFQAKYKIEGGAGTCEPETWWGDLACPKVWVHTTFEDRTLNKNHGYQFAVPPYVQGSWNDLYGYIDTTQKMIDANDLRLYVGNGPKLSKIVLDDVSLEEVQRNCTDLLINGDAETGDARGWRRYGTSNLGVSSDANTGSYAISNTNRQKSWAGLEQLVDVTCMEVDVTYMIIASIKLLNGSLPFDCKAVNRCPKAMVEAHFNPSNVPTKRIGLDNEFAAWEDWDGSSYNLFTATFLVDNNMATADQVAIVFRNPTELVDMLLDDVSVVRL